MIRGAANEETATSKGTAMPNEAPVEHLRTAWEELTAPGGGFAMSEIKVRGIPMRVFDSAARPPSHRPGSWRRCTATRTTSSYEDERYTYADVDGQVRALAHHLRDEHGVGSGDRVALAMRNYPEWVAGYWATVVLGAAVVGMNAWWTTAELEYGLQDSRPKVLIADDERLERVLPVLEGLRQTAPLAVIAVRSDRDLPDGAASWDTIVDAGAVPPGLPDAEIDPDDDATIFYTSGTTGFPKGAQLTHRGCVHNVLHLVFWNLVTTMANARADAEAPAGDQQAGDEPDNPLTSSKQLVFMAPTPPLPRDRLQLPAAPLHPGRRAHRVDPQVGPPPGRWS